MGTWRERREAGRPARLAPLARRHTAPPAYNEQQIEWLYHGAGNIGAAERAALKHMLRHGLGVPALALLVQRGMVAATATPPPEVLPHPSPR